MTLQIKVLGGLSVMRDGAPLTGPVAQRRSRALLAVLAAHSPGGVSREKAATLLWPESDETAARNSLKQVVFVLRRELGPDVVLGSTELRLNPLAISSDLAEFEIALLQGDGERLEEAHPGPFLDGFHLGGDAREFERWADSERRVLARRFGEALEALARHAVLAGDHRTALRLWHRLAGAAPLDSGYAVDLVKLLLATGDRAGALRHAEAHRALLHAELELPLGAELEALITAARIAPAPVPPDGAPVTSLVPPPAAVVAIGPFAVAPATPAQPTRRHWAARVVAVAVLVAAIAVPAWKLLPRAQPLRPQRVALAAAVHPGDDPVVAAKVRLLVEVIARRLVSARVVTPFVLPATVGVDARDAASRAGVQYLVEAIAGRGSADVEVALVDVASGARLWGSRMAGDDQAHADALAERATTAVAVRVDPIMANWISATSEPASIESYQVFARGLTSFAEGEMADAETRFRAAARDSGFTMAQVLAAWCNHYQGRQSVADSITRALLTRRLPPLELVMMRLQAAIGAQDMDGQHRAAQAIATTAGAGEWRYLAVDVALNEGRGREAVRILEDIGPDTGWMRGSFGYWVRMGRALHYLGAYDKELAAAVEARRRFPSNRILSQVYIKALVGLGRVDAVEAEIDRALTLRQKWSWGDSQPMDQAMSELLAHGHPEGARRVAARTMAWLRQQPVAEQDPWAGDTPWFLFIAGEVDAARAAVERAIANDPRELVEGLQLLAEIGVAVGDSGAARRVDAQLAAMSDPGLKVDVLVTRAGIAAALGERDQAVAFLRDSFRAGFAWRTVLHIDVSLVRLRGYPPFEQLIGPVE